MKSKMIIPIYIQKTKKTNKQKVVSEEIENSA